uniref:Uncharacterized protein n=1 Tax=Sphaeramia orbicularis TaxID=375764 RepID=A0A672Z7A6_9TELE
MKFSSVGWLGAPLGIGQWMDFSLIISADMNACLNLVLDRSAQHPTSTQLHFIFYSGRHQTFSRIDHILETSCHENHFIS